MPHPTTSLATYRPEAAAAFEEFNLAADRQGFIGLKVAPVLDVGVVANEFSKIPIEQLLHNPDTERAPGSGYQRGNFTFIKDSYHCKENGWEEVVDDTERAMYRDWIDSDLYAFARAYDAVLRNHERRVADLIMNTTTWAGAALTTDVNDEWSDYENATPIDDVEAAVRKVRANSGIWPNAIVLPKLAFRNLRLCEQIIERVRNVAGYDPTQRGLTASALASVFDIPNVIVAGGTKNTADAGQDATLTDIWNPDRAMICHLNGIPDTKIPTIARTFHWAGDGSEVGGRFESYRDETKRSDIFRVRNQTDEKVMYPQLGHLLTGIN